MDDFFTWSSGYLVDLGFLNAIPLRDWKAKYPVGRMTAPGYCWIFGAVYRMQIQTADTGELFTTFSEAYTNTINLRYADIATGLLNSECASQEMADLLGQKVGEMTGISHSAEGYPSNMQPALSVAVDSGISNADKAWEIFMGRTVKPDYSSDPQWAIVPRNKTVTVSNVPSTPAKPIIQITR